MISEHRAYALPKRAVAATVTVVATAGLLPFGAHQLPASVSFVPALIAIVTIVDLMSVYLLLGDYLDRGDLRLAVMAGAYAWSLVVMAGYALAFPGAVGVDPPLALTPSTAPYLYTAWHGGFPVLLALAWAPWAPRWTQPVPREQRTRLAGVLMTSFVLAGLATVAALCGTADRLPVLIQGLDTSRMTTLTAPLVLSAVLLALVVTVRGTRERSGPERWTAVAVLACLCDLLLTYTSRSRFSLGWYSGRTLTIVAAAVVLLAMQASFRALKAQAERDATIDALTGLSNRRGAYTSLDQMIARARRTGTPLGIISFDLDWFKRINDRFGHVMGDQVLAGVGAGLTTLLRRGDLAARVGGEEFLLALHDTDAAGAVVAAERLRSMINAMAIPGLDQPVTASFGTTVLLDSDADAALLLRRVDAALYLSKEHGRNRVESQSSDAASTGETEMTRSEWSASMAATP